MYFKGQAVLNDGCFKCCFKYFRSLVPLARPQPPAWSYLFTQCETTLCRSGVRLEGRGLRELLS